MIFPAGSTTRIRIFALDAANGGVLWVHERRYPADLTAYAVFHPNNRGVALYQDKVYFGTLDAKVVALDAKTGKVIWEKPVADYTAGYYFNAAPMIVKGKVVMGTSGPGEMGIRGFIQALNADTGEEVWKTWVVPAAGEPGSETWAGVLEVRRRCGLDRRHLRSRNEPHPVWNRESLPLYLGGAPGG
jgi:alcohol dehydrogenase (cytochrome c)